ncbi:MAG: hypothetical protein C9356_10460 [Oleiphilus sp.]|nr:MAG: hypothetical protein C9356_10460 [Oleiphilus sp.]
MNMFIPHTRRSANTPTSKPGYHYPGLWRQALVRSSALILGLVLSMASHGIELFEEDEMGNINQRNIGVFKSQQLIQSSGDSFRLEKQSRPLPAFTAITLGTPAELEYSETGPNRIEIEAPAATLRALRVEVRAGKLIIDTNGLQPDSTPTLRVFGQHLEELDIRTAANARLHDILAKRFHLKVKGASDIEISGQAKDCELDIQGASDIDQSGLRCDHIALRTFGANDIRLHASQSVSGRVQGAGDIDVSGNPARREVQVMGASDIHFH